MRELQGAMAREARVDMGQLIRNLGVASAAGVFLAMVGALGTDEWPLARRLLYWLPLMLLVSPLGLVIGAVIERLPAQPRHPAALWALVTLGVAVPGTLIVWTYTNGWNGWGWPVSSIPQVFIPTLVITAGMAALIMAIERPGTVTHAPAGQPASAESAAPSAPFLRRLPPKLAGGRLLAVKSEDHYLRLYTTRGEDLILFRLADALAELEGLEGAQTHRSWWVARDAVTGTTREDGRVSLTLENGVAAPVSRPNVKPLRDAGWLN